MIKNPPANAGDIGWIPGAGRYPGGGNGTHSSILAWEIPGTGEPGRLQSMGSQRVGQTEQLSLHRFIYCMKKSLHVDGKEDTFFFCLKARFPSFNTALETQSYRSVTQFITCVSECNLLSLKEPSS